MDFDDIIGKFKDYADVAMDKMGKVSKTAASKTENAVSRAKLKFSISEAKDKIDEIYKSIGESVYSYYLEHGSVDEEATEQCKKIDDLNKEIEDLNSQLADLRAMVKCTYCGVYNKTDAVFCSKCGAKLEKNEAENNYTAETEVVEVSDEDIQD